MAEVARKSRKANPNRGSKPGERRGGRQKGTPNKLTASAKEAFELAFDGLGGADGLRKWAKENPTDFYKLYARLIPRPLEHSGPNGRALDMALTVVPKFETAEKWAEWAAKQQQG